MFMSSDKKAFESDVTTAESVISSHHKITLEALATLLLRLLGIYFIVFALTGVVAEAVRIIHAANKLSLDLALQAEWPYLVRPVVELILGSYFLLGGQWVFEKILTPMVHQPTEDASEETSNAGS
jgi:hypothetical protein